LALLDPIHNVSIEQLRKPDVKFMTDMVLQRMTDLGWIRPDVAHSYLAASGPQGAERAKTIYESLPEAERFVPLSVKARRNQNGLEPGTSGTLF
jgi:hypothetical protein